MMEEASRRLPKLSGWAADAIVWLAKDAASESVKLEACRTLLADMTHSLGPRLEITSEEERGLFKNSDNE
jgi:hypothetical protein